MDPPPRQEPGKASIISFPSWFPGFLIDVPFPFRAFASPCKKKLTHQPGSAVMQICRLPRERGGAMRITAVDPFYLKMPEVTEAADGTQDTLLLRVRTDAGLDGRSRS